MSGMYEVWSANGAWYATRWYYADREYAGPFATKDDALAWATRRSP